MAINIDELPKHIKDIVEIREDTDVTFHRFISEDYTDWFFEWLIDRSDISKHQSAILSLYGSQGIGKSSAAITICSILDPTFSADNIFFNYNELVEKRSKLKDGAAVLVDEQSQTFGLDAHRVNVVLSNLKEQLRKRSIHFIMCAPVLYPESSTSMYILEVLWVDFEQMESYAALKTREGMTLGHVRIPYPLKEMSDGVPIQNKAFMDAYEAKKDQHLEHVLGRKSMDIFEERAQMLMRHPIFKKAEQIYKSRMGYVPKGTVVQLVNKIYPEFGAGVTAVEIAERVKLDKELKGDWDVTGMSYASKRRKAK
jgi:ABC-type dipeptide/oligopeptide/nickel transport system ATPase component